MLVRFRSTATESITMFGDIATELLRLMGATGRVPGALSPEEVPSALKRLESALDQITIQQQTQTPARPADNEDSATDEDKEDDAKPAVSLPTRAVPLVSIMKRAAAAHKELMWEVQ
ncbi:MAG TPA: DUF1840 domain-containing protein [Steroidobacteraceae bacterium]|nr:DUF1840 domain-containing protein [Steroidobacteraceae bacterium]